VARKRKSLEQKLARIKDDTKFFEKTHAVTEDERKKHLKSLVRQRQLAIHYNYSKMPKSPKKDNQKNIIKTYDWADREETVNHRFFITKSRRVFCIDCNHSQDSMQKCSNCGSEKLVRLTPDARVPRKNANKRVWKNFIKNFISLT
jgi:hypothetical protein